MTKAESMIQYLVDEGFDPRAYRLGMSERLGCTPEEWDAAVEKLQAPKAIDGKCIADRSRYDSHANDGAGREWARQAERAFEEEERKA